MVDANQSSAAANVVPVAQLAAPAALTQPPKLVPNVTENGGCSRDRWTTWKKRWESFAIVANLKSQPQEYQVACLTMCLTEETLEIVENLPYKDPAERKAVNKILGYLENHLVGKVNEIYESYRFFSRQQEEFESISAYVTAVHAQASTCNFGRPSRAPHPRPNCVRHSQQSVAEVTSFGIKPDTGVMCAEMQDKRGSRSAGTRNEWDKPGRGAGYRSFGEHGHVTQTVEGKMEHRTRAAGSASSAAEYTESHPAQPMARLATSAKEGTISHQSAAQGHVKEQISEAQEQCTSWRRKIPRPLMKMDTGL